jgi:hypothetical protein
VTESLAPGANFDVDQFPTLTGLTESDLLAVLDRVLPEWYLLPLKDPGPGYEWFQALAAMLANVSSAIFRSDQSLFILYSNGGALAEADVEFFRASDAAGAFTVNAGTIVRTSRTNRSFELISDVAFGVNDLARPGQVRAVAPAGEYNVPGPVITADGTTLPGEIDIVSIPRLDPVLAEPTIQVRQIADAAGGRASVLDQLGLDRNLPRVFGEPDDIYKGRIRQLPDTVSPAALNRQLDAIFFPMGLSYQLIETWQNEYQTCYDFPSFDIVSNTMGIAESNCFAFDDPSSEIFRGRLLDERDYLSGMVVVVPETGAWSDRSLAFDDVGTVGPSSTYSSLSTFDFQAYGSGASVLVITDSSIWTAQFSSRFPGDTTNGFFNRSTVTGALTDFGGGLGLAITFMSGSDLIEVRDGERFNIGTNSWVDFQCVGVLVRTTATAYAVSQIEDAVNTTSLLIHCSVPDANPAKSIQVSFIASGEMAVCPLTDGLASNETPRGWRAVSVLDAPDRDLGFFHSSFTDGYDPLHNQFYKQLNDLLQQIKGGGTNSVIELSIQLSPEPDTIPEAESTIVTMLIAMGGDSNSEGQGGDVSKGDPGFVGLSIPNDQVQFNSRMAAGVSDPPTWVDFTTNLVTRSLFVHNNGSGDFFGHEITLGQELLLSDINPAIAKLAMTGSTAGVEWLPTSTFMVATTGMNLFNTWVARNRSWQIATGKLLGFCVWDLAMNDATDSGLAAAYAANMAAIATAAAVAFPGLKQVLIRLHTGTTASFKATVIAAQVALVAANPTLRLIDTDDLALIADNLNYNADAHLTIGQRIVGAGLALIGFPDREVVGIPDVIGFGPAANGSGNISPISYGRVRDGDLEILVIVTGIVIGTTIATPSGWTAIGSTATSTNSGVSVHVALFSRAVTTAMLLANRDHTAPTTYVANDTGNRAQIFAIRGPSLNPVVDATATFAPNTFGTTMTVPALTTGVSNTRVLCFACSLCGSQPTNTVSNATLNGFTQIYDGARQVPSTDWLVVSVGSGTLASASSSGTFGVTSDSNNFFIAATVSIKS